MKLLYVISSLGTGGAEKILVEEANYFSNHGYEVSIIVFSGKRPFYELNKNIKIIKMNYYPSRLPLYKYMKNPTSIIMGLYKIFKEEEPNIIISFITKTNLYSILSARLAKRKIIVSEHTNFTRNDNDILGFFRKLIYPLADALVVLTKYDKIRYNFVENVYVIHNPLVISNKYSNLARQNVILGVGRLVDLKGFDLLIKAFARLKLKEWRLLIVGEGEKKQKLESLAETLNVKNQVIFPGVTNDIEKYYKEASIFVLSSRIEGFPNALCEAMGYGCPSIAFDCLTGPRDIVQNNDTGILVEAENLVELTDSIRLLVENKCLRNQLSSKSTTILQKLDIEKISKQWIQVFKDLKVVE